MLMRFDLVDLQLFIAVAETRSITKATGWAGALTYVPSRTVRFAINFEQTRFTAGSSVSTSTSTSTTADRKTENALFGRAQVNF